MCRHSSKFIAFSSNSASTSLHSISNWVYLERIWDELKCAVNNRGFPFRIWVSSQQEYPTMNQSFIKNVNIWHDCSQFDRTQSEHYILIYYGKNGKFYEIRIPVHSVTTHYTLEKCERWPVMLIQCVLCTKIEKSGGVAIFFPSVCMEHNTESCCVWYKWWKDNAALYLCFFVVCLNCWYTLPETKWPPF